jgi:hypothetical protein
MLAGNARERKTGSTRYAGELRSGRKCRMINRTKSEMHKSATMAKISEPAADAIVNSWASRSFLKVRHNSEDSEPVRAGSL